MTNPKDFYNIVSYCLSNGTTLKIFSAAFLTGGFALFGYVSKKYGYILKVQKKPDGKESSLEKKL